jgi:hypothetical protein
MEVPDFRRVQRDGKWKLQWLHGAGDIQQDCGEHCVGCNVHNQLPDTFTNSG